jgi:hypothetical protein
MKHSVQVVVVALLAALFVSPALAKEKGKARQAPTGAFSPIVKKAVPGIDAIVKLTKEQRQQIAAVRKEILGSEQLTQHRNKAQDKNASKEDKQAARKALQEAQAQIASRSKGIIGEDQLALIAQVNAAAEEVQNSLKSEFQQKMKDAKKDPEARKRLQKELAEKSAVQISNKVTGMLSAEQKEALQAAAAKQGKKGQAKKDRPKKDKVKLDKPKPDKVKKDRPKKDKAKKV